MSTVNTRFKEVVDDFNRGSRGIADYLSVSHGTINGYMKEKSPKQIGSDFITILADKIPVNVNWLLKGEGKKYLKEWKTEDLFDYKTKNFGIDKGIDSEINDRIKSVRKDKGLSQVEFCEKMGASRQIQGSLENYRQNATVHYMRLLFEAFGVNINWVITGVGTMYVPDRSEYKEGDVDGMKKELEETRRENRTMSLAMESLERQLAECMKATA